MYNCVRAYFNFYCQKDQLLKEKYFIDFRLINKNSDITFISYVFVKTNILIDTGNKYCLDKFDALYLCEYNFSQFDNSFYFVIKNQQKQL